MNCARRAHPVMIFEFLWKFAYLLIIPVVRGAVTGFLGGFRAWLAGAWWDVLVVVLITALATLKWACIRYRYSADGLWVRQGLLFRNEFTVPVARINTLSVSLPFLWRPIFAVRLRADSLAGSINTQDVNLVVRKRDALELFDLHSRQLSKNQKYNIKEYKPRGVHIAALSAILSNSFAGVVLAAAFLSQAGRLLGSEFEQRLVGTLERVTRLLAFGLPPVTAALAYLLLGGWLIAFVQNLLTHGDFLVRRSRGQLLISGGLLSRHLYSISLDAINYIDIRQSIFTRMLGLHSVFIHAVGYGKNEDAAAVLVPAETTRGLRGNLRLLLPHFDPSPRQTRPSGPAIFRFCTDPLIPTLVLPLAAYILYLLFPSWAEVIWWVGLMALIPSLWFLIVRILDFCTSGIGREGDMLTLRYSRGFHLSTVLLPIDKVTQVLIRSSLIQRPYGRCDLFIYSVSERTHSHHIRDVDVETAMRLLGLPGEQNPCRRRAKR